MDPGGAYNLSEICSGFQLSNANATSSSSYGLDPMVTDHVHRSNHHHRSSSSSSPNRNSRKRRGEYGGGGGEEEVSTSNNSNATNNVSNEGDNRRVKAPRPNENNENKVEGEGISDKAAELSAKPAEPPKQGYIHVRARRGQATDSHSLAERARREKIGERMKILQDLVPGCNKVIGKALVLDEIINYIQSLQCQVEFLSMKLEAVNGRAAIDGYPSKDQTFEAPLAFGSQSSREYGRGSPEWLHMQIGGSFERPS